MANKFNKKRRAVKASKRRVLAANNSNVSVSKIKKFIEDSVNNLQNTNYTNSRLILDNDLCLYVGYSDGFDTEDGYAICAKIAERNDGDWADFDYLNMPWNTYDDNDGSTGVFEGDVYDTNIEITPGEDYSQDAQWLADSYTEIRNLLDEGKLTIESSCSKKSVKASNLMRNKKAPKRSIKSTRVYRDGLRGYTPWSGAVDTWDNLEKFDKIDVLEQVLDDAYYDESAGEGVINETELNDLLWFEPETVYEWVGLYYNDETGEVSDEPFDDEEEEDFYEDEEIEESVKAKRRSRISAAKKRISASRRRKGAKIMASNNDDMLTTNLADFGRRELAETRDLLDAMLNNGLPDDFENEGVVVAFNRNSGYVFLTNDEYQVAMVDDDGKLYSWYFTPYYGHEGSYEDLLAEALDGDWDDEVSEDYEYLKDLAENVYDDAENAEKLQEIIDRINGGDDDEE